MPALRQAAAIAVGSEAFSRLAFVGFSRMRAMSSDCCRPFSRDRPGLLFDLTKTLSGANIYI